MDVRCGVPLEAGLDCGYWIVDIGPHTAGFDVGKEINSEVNLSLSALRSDFPPRRCPAPGRPLPADGGTPPKREGLAVEILGITHAFLTMAGMK